MARKVSKDSWQALIFTPSLKFTWTEPSSKRSKVSKNPGVDTSFLPDREREEAERKAREELRQEWIRKQEELKAFIKKLKAEHHNDVEKLKDYINQSRAESSAKDGEIKALQSANDELKAAYSQLEKDMGEMDENYQTHILEVDARARMELMKEYKNGDHLNWKPDDVIEEYYMLFPDATHPEKEPAVNLSTEDNQTINEMRAQGDNQAGEEQGGGDA